MAEHNDIGKKGEELAQKYLSENGYTIRDTNWYYGKEELDIIAEKNMQIIIVEVKTRTSNYFGEPFVAVNRKKQQSLVRAADHYLRKFKLENEARFDVISVLINAYGHKLTHLEDAFYPTI